MAVGAQRVAGVRRPILPDCASLHPGYGEKVYNGIKIYFTLIFRFGKI